MSYEKGSAAVTNIGVDFIHATEELIALSTAPPLTEIVIGGVTYPLGPVSQEQAARIHAMGVRLGDGSATAEDRWPWHMVQALLQAGNPDIDLTKLGDIPPEVTLAATQEVMRQCVVAALANNQGNV
jgi:hypothetical protein